MLDIERQILQNITIIEWNFKKKSNYKVGINLKIREFCELNFQKYI